jgi:hypothetical protein
LRSSERKTGLRHALSAGLLHRECDTEISYESMSALEQDVLGFDVAMDDAAVVGVL